MAYDPKPSLTNPRRLTAVLEPQSALDQNSLPRKTHELYHRNASAIADVLHFFWKWSKYAVYDKIEATRHATLRYVDREPRCD